MNKENYVITESALSSFSKIAFGSVSHYLDDREGVMNDIQKRVKKSIPYGKNLNDLLFSRGMKLPEGKVIEARYYFPIPAKDAAKEKAKLKRLEPQESTLVFLLEIEPSKRIIGVL